MEETLTQKMKDFMTVLDQVKKYRALLTALPDLIIILGLAIIATISASLYTHLSIIYVSYLNPNWLLANTVMLISLAAGVIGGAFWVNWKIRKTTTGQWKPALSEGAPGAVKLLQGMDWDTAYRDIRHAKLSFIVYGAMKTAGYWLLTFVISYLAARYISSSIHVSFNPALIALFALALALLVAQKDIRRRYDQIGRLDALLWELRWMDNDLRHNPFQT